MKNNINTILKNLLKYGPYAATLLVGLLVGWMIFGGNNANKNVVQTEEVNNHEGEIWTCSMHPQIRQDKPGKCPICGMDLILLEDMDNSLGDFQVSLSENARKIADVSTVKAIRQEVSGELFLSGKITTDERSVAEISSHVKGRIEKLYVNFTGQKVYSGQVLATVYSPELVSAQQELIQSAGLKNSRPEFYNAAVQKLLLWRLSKSQIKKIEDSGEVQYAVPILSPIGGTVTKRKISLGEHVMEGSEMFEVSNLSKLWVVFDAYESDLTWLKKGQKITFSVKSVPGKEFAATISFIDPVLDPQTRVAGVRAEVANPDGLLRPEMLIKGKVSFSPVNKTELLVPATSILWTGKKSVVYVRDPFNEGVFSYREVVTGSQVGNSFIVLSGLSEGEEIASNGVFKIDAAAQLQGKKSMMNEVLIDSNKGSVDETVVFQNVSESFSQQMNEVVDNYLLLKDDLVASDKNSAAKHSENLKKAIDEVKMETLSGASHVFWMDFLAIVNPILQDLTKENPLIIQRQKFSIVSEELYKIVKAFQINNKRLYYQHCPMANSEKGSFWLSSEIEIKNPYYGEEMLTCGSVTDSIK
ncbi:MAG: efflux RND transporter periplasmic adaptor subunit [Cyclobacteriaceae bacterium]|nr:efflux RND transporter periplasmic adaptor subunit [Cyclobacteriaceae bacterium]